MGVHGPFIIFGFHKIDVHVMGITTAVINGDGAFLLYESASLTLKGVLDGTGSVEFRLICIDAVVVDFAAISVFGMVIGAGFAPC